VLELLNATDSDLKTRALSYRSFLHQARAKQEFNCQDLKCDFLNSDQARVFSDEICVLANQLVSSALILVDQHVLFFYRDASATLFNPFRLS
jgi:hypothetical protein